MNLSNFLQNKEPIMATQQMASDGHQLAQAMPLTSSIQGSGIFKTRYLFRKAK